MDHNGEDVPEEKIVTIAKTLKEHKDMKVSRSLDVSSHLLMQLLAAIMILSSNQPTFQPMPLK